MSRAFVKEQDDGSQYEDLADRPVSSHPNYVTAEGLVQIDNELTEAHRQCAEAQAAGDRSAMAHAARDERYSSATRNIRRSSPRPAGM